MLLEIKETVKPEHPSTILLMGPLNTRKTTTAATASSKFPKNLLAIPPTLPPWPNTPAQLDDVFFICWDKDALLGFPRLGISVPHVYLANAKPRELLPTKDRPDPADSVIPALHAEVDKRVREGKVNVLVHDTMGAFDHKVLALATELFDAGVEKSDDRTASTKLYRAVFKMHLSEFQFYTSLRKPDGTAPLNVFLFHTTVKGEPMTTDSKQLAKVHTQNLAKGLQEDGGQITARITGQAWEFYMNHCGLIMLASVQGPENGKAAVLYPKGGRNSLTRDRGGVLSDKEPGDLAAILRKYKP